MTTLGVFVHWFCDWLTLRQNHPEGGLPVVGDHLIERVELGTGRVVSSTLRSLKLEGSHDSRLLVRCDGETVEATGNFSKWGRVDNLFGLALDDCVSVASQVCADLLGLPPFTPPTHVRQASVGQTLIHDGAQFSRVDVTHNLAVGQGRELVALRALSACARRGKVGDSFPNGRTVDWLRGSKHRYVKAYQKAPMLPAGEAKDWATLHGIVRVEHGLKSSLLRREGWSLWQPGRHWFDMVEACRMWERETLGSVSAAVTSLDDVERDLMALGWDRLPASHMQAYAHSWGCGVDLSQKLRQADGKPSKTWYRVRNALKLVGLDITGPFDVRRHSLAVRVVEFTEMAAPDWYWKRQA